LANRQRQPAPSPARTMPPPAKNSRNVNTDFPRGVELTGFDLEAILVAMALPHPQDAVG
jgi:hypothetical protein